MVSVGPADSSVGLLVLLLILLLLLFGVVGMVVVCGR